MVGLIGLDKCMVKSGTVCSEREAPMLKSMEFKVSPVVRTAIEVSGGDDTKLKEAMRKLAMSDPCVLCFQDPQTGENIVAGAGELHLEVCLRRLEGISGVRVRASQPVVDYAETVTDVGEVCLAKSSNKLNRIWISAEPMPEELQEELGRFSSLEDIPSAERFELFQAHGFDRRAVRRIVASHGCNFVLNAVEGKDISPIADSVARAFRYVLNCVQCASRSGPRAPVVDHLP